MKSVEPVGQIERGRAGVELAGVVRGLEVTVCRRAVGHRERSRGGTSIQQERELTARIVVLGSEAWSELGAVLRRSPALGRWMPSIPGGCANMWRIGRVLAEVEPSAERREVGGDCNLTTKAACPVVLAGVLAGRD